jgi:hypothetical protein
MSATIWVRERVTCPTLEQVETYLRAHGWVQGEPHSSGWRIWHHPPGHSLWSLPDLPDVQRVGWHRVAAGIIEALAINEERSERAIALEMLGETP